MNLEEFKEKKLYIDLEYYGLDTARFGDNSSKTYKKFHKVISEIASKNIVGMVRNNNNNKLSFIDNNNKVIGIKGVDKEYKERLIRGNAFIHEFEGYKLNPLIPTYIKKLTTNSPAKTMLLSIKGIDYEFIEISDIKDSYLKKSIQTYGNQKLLTIPKAIFISYYVYVTGNNYANSFGVRGSDGSSYHVGVTDYGVYITLKTIK